MGILVVGGEKGGTGKSTIAVNLAAMLARSGKDVLLVDTDTQPSSSMWAATRDDFHHSQAPRVACVQRTGKISKQLIDFRDRYEEVIVDAGGRESVELRHAIAVCTEVVFPIRPGQFDSWTLGRLDKVMCDLNMANHGLYGRLVISSASTNLAIREAEETKEFIESEEFEHLKLSEVVIRERISYRKAIREGLGVVEWKDQKTKKRDEKAVEEITALYKEIYGG